MKKVKKVFLIIAIVIVTLITINFGVTPQIYHALFECHIVEEGTLEALILSYDNMAEYNLQTYDIDVNNYNVKGYYFNKETADGLVIFSSGINGGADRYNGVFKYLLDNNLAVFAYDNIGAGNSEGHNQIGFPQAIINLEAILKYLKGKNFFDFDNVYLMGHSMGGYAVTCTYLDEYSEIDKIVAMSAPYNAEVTIIETARKFIGPLVYLAEMSVIPHQRALFGKELSTRNSYDVINENNLPTLIIQGTEDEIVNMNFSLASQYKKITNPNVKYQILDTNHYNYLSSEKALEYQEIIDEEYQDILNNYKNDELKEKLNEFYLTVEPNKYLETNAAIFDSVISFLREA